LQKSGIVHLLYGQVGADFLPQDVRGLQKCKNDEKYKLTSTAMEVRARTKNEKTLYMTNNIFFI
jgi:hypothetical protein